MPSGFKKTIIPFFQLSLFIPLIVNGASPDELGQLGALLTAVFYYFGIPISVLIVWLLTLFGAKVVLHRNPNQETLLWRNTFLGVVFLNFLIYVIFIWYKNIVDDIVLFLSGSNLAILILYAITFYVRRSGAKFFNTYFFSSFVVVSAIFSLYILWVVSSSVLVGLGNYCDSFFMNDWANARCLTNKAIVSGDVKICESINDVDRQDLCFSNLAEAKGNPQFCDFLSDRQFGIIGKRACYNVVLYQTGRALHCRNTPDVAKCYKMFLGQ